MASDLCYFSAAPPAISGAAIMNLGRTLKLFLVDGTPSGVITAELGVSNIRAVVASRTVLPQLIHRPEAAQTGVYLLAGPDPDDTGGQLVYVGEGDQIKTRLASHDADDAKDFFTRVVFVVSKDENLTKAHGRYLESRLIAAIHKAGRAKLVNGIDPPFKGLPEPEKADMERVLSESEILLPVLGFYLLRPAGQEVGIVAPKDQISVKTASNDEKAIFQFTLGGTNAKARESSGEFVVLTGSLAKGEENAACPDAVKQRRADLIKEGALVSTDNRNLLRFTKDIAFDSPSGAGRVIYGATSLDLSTGITK
jgi:hypothetical protein